MTATNTSAGAAAPLFNAAEHGLDGVALVPTDHVDQGKFKARVAQETKQVGALMVPRAKLKVAPGFNVRARTESYDAHVQSIARSMHTEGWLQSKPVEAFVDSEGSLVVTDGHTRLEAFDVATSTMGCGIDLIPVVVTEGRSMADMTVGLVKQNQGRPLQPIEVAVVVKRLTAWGWDAAKVAERLDLSVPYVKELLALINAPEALVALVQDGTVSASTAAKAIKKKGAKAATAAIVAQVEVKQEEAKVEAAADAPKGKPVKAPKKVKVVDSDLGQSKAQVAVAKVNRAMPKVEKITLLECMKALRAVKSDPAFGELAEATRVALAAIVG